MEYTEIAIKTTTCGTEFVTAFLFSHGVYYLSIDDANDIREILSSKDHWDYVDDSLIQRADILEEPVMVKACIPNDGHGRDTITHIKAGLKGIIPFSGGIDIGTLEIVENTVNDENWANSWKQFFKPLEIGERILIKPVWETIDPPAGKTILEIDPGMAFGTGSHETTQLCIEALERYVKKGSCILDIGCGSGILSIAALLLGAKSAVGVDIDENSARITRENGIINGLSEPVLTAYTENILENDDFISRLGQYDIITANIVADVITALIPKIRPLLKVNGLFIASGIIEERAGDVESALMSYGYKVYEKCDKNGWISVVFGTLNQ